MKDVKANLFGVGLIENVSEEFLTNSGNKY